MTDVRTTSVPSAASERQQRTGYGPSPFAGTAPGLRRDEARPRSLLPGGRGAAHARARRAADPHGAVPGGRGRAVDLPEAGAEERARLARDDRPRDAQTD